MQDKGLLARIAALEGQVVELTDQVERLWKVMRGELAMDGQTPLERNPGKKDTKKDAMSAIARKRLRQQLAAVARASKPKGLGKGAVKTAAMQRKLRREALGEE